LVEDRTGGGGCEVLAVLGIRYDQGLNLELRACEP
jgi:hypothetical protein